jgi:hypothetical protein
MGVVISRLGRESTEIGIKTNLIIQLLNNQFLE